MWFRLTCPVVAGETPSPLQRVAAAADFGNGVSALFDDGRHTFINADLTISLSRLPGGRVGGHRQRQHAAPGGVGVAESALLDEDGRIGRAAAEPPRRPGLSPPLTRTPATPTAP